MNANFRFQIWRVRRALFSHSVNSEEVWDLSIQITLPLNKMKLQR